MEEEIFKKIKITKIILVILIVTLLVISSFLILTGNDPLKNARENKFKENIKLYEKEVNSFIQNEGSTEKELVKINAKKDPQNRDYDIKDVIPSIKEAYLNKLEVKQGKLSFIGKNKEEILWFKENI